MTLDDTLTRVLAPYADRLATRLLRVGPDLVAAAPLLLRQVLPAGPWLLVGDEATWQAAGAACAASCTRAGQPFVAHRLTSPHGEALVADDAQVAALRQVWATTTPRPVALVAIGAGSVNDIAKMAAHQAGVPYAVIATASSMNGYTSAIAALLSHGVKTTQPCRPPVAVLGDLAVLAAAPARLIAAGYGDLLSRPVSNADWLLSHRLTGSVWSADTLTVIQAAEALLAGVAPGLRRRELAAVGALMASLLLSGAAMTLAGSSAPASGGEHLISHFLDMEHHALGTPHDLHGCQVGVATLTTAGLYEALLAWEPRTLDIAARVAAQPSWPVLADQLRRELGPLAASILPHAEAAHADPATLRAHLEYLRAHWPELRAELASHLHPAAELRALLRQAGAPVRYRSLGATTARARRAILLARQVRHRYTILHLAAEVGQLSTWTRALLPALR